MSEMQWQWSKPRWQLLLCAIGLHKFDLFCASSSHDRDTRRECYACGHSNVRATASEPWE